MKTQNITGVSFLILNIKLFCVLIQNQHIHIRKTSLKKRENRLKKKEKNEDFLLLFAIYSSINCAVK